MLTVYRYSDGGLGRYWIWSYGHKLCSKCSALGLRMYEKMKGITTVLYCPLPSFLNWLKGAAGKMKRENQEKRMGQLLTYSLQQWLDWLHSKLDHPSNISLLLYLSSSRWHKSVSLKFAPMFIKSSFCSAFDWLGRRPDSQQLIC